MSSAAALLDNLQADVHGILAATPSLALARHLLDNKGELEGALENELATTNDNSGKCGLAVIVLAVEVEDAIANLPGPPLHCRVDIQCIEHVELNRSAADGTLVRSSTAATLVLAALNQYSLGAHVLQAAKKPITPLKMRAGFVAHLVSVRTLIGGPAGGKTAAVEVFLQNKIPGPGKRVELTCSTPGAAIHYTIDGSFPAPATATLYSGVFDLPPVATTIRAAAFAANLSPSDILEFIVT